MKLTKNKIDMKTSKVPIAVYYLFCTILFYLNTMSGCYVFPPFFSFIAALTG